VTGLAQWAVPVAERRRLRFSFQNQQCQRAGLESTGRNPLSRPPGRLETRPSGRGSAVPNEPISLCQPTCSLRCAVRRPSAWSAVSIDRRDPGQPAICSRA